MLQISRISLTHRYYTIPSSMKDLSSSLDNYFVPLFAFTYGTIISVRNRGRCMLYNIPVREFTEYPNFIRTKHSFNKYFERAGGGTTFQRDDDTMIYEFLKYCVYVTSQDGSIITPLFLFAVRNSYINVIDMDNVDRKQLCMIVNNEIFDPKHKRLLTRVKAIINDNKDIDILYTNNINDVCFKPARIKIKFNTIEEMNEYFNSIREMMT